MNNIQCAILSLNWPHGGKALMFGYYDPLSLREDKGQHVMNFISAGNIDDVTRIVIDSQEKALEVIDALGEQKAHFIAWLGGGVERVRGSLRINDSHPDEGIMETQDGNIMPIKMNFMPDKDQLPQYSLCVATGVHDHGALRVAKMIVHPIDPYPKPGDPAGEAEKKLD